MVGVLSIPRHALLNGWYVVDPVGMRFYLVGMLLIRSNFHF